MNGFWLYGPKKKDGFIADLHSLQFILPNSIHCLNIVAYQVFKNPLILQFKASSETRVRIPTSFTARICQHPGWSVVLPKLPLISIWQRSVHLDKTGALEAELYGITSQLGYFPFPNSTLHSTIPNRVWEDMA